MRIHHVMPANGRIPHDVVNGPRSGITHAALSMARDFALRGHDTRLVGWSEGKPRQQVSPEGARVRTHPGFQVGRVGRWDVRWLVPMALDSASSARPDVLHVHGDPNLLRLRGALRILHLHTPVPPQANLAFRRLLERADAVVCCSRYLRNQFLAITEWDSTRTFAIPNGTDIEHFRPATPVERSTARARFGLSEDSLVILYVGSITEEKGVLPLARAMRHVTEHLPQAILVVAGGANLWGGLGNDSARREAYERRVAEAAPADTRMLGTQPYEIMPQVLHAADLVIVPSLWEEPFGMVALDAAAAGLPVIASRTGGLTEIVLDGSTGILVSPGDEEALIRAIGRLGQDADLRLLLGGAARARARRFTWGQAGRALHEVYWQAFERQKSPEQAWQVLR